MYPNTLIFLFLGYAMMLSASPIVIPQVLPRTNNTLETRHKSGVDCGFCRDKGYVGTGYNSVNGNADYLKGKGGSCFVKSKGEARVACESSSAIFLYNENDYDIAPNCEYIGTYATDIITACYYPGSGTAVCGKASDTDNYSVVVRAANCKTGMR